MSFSNHSQPGLNFAFPRVSEPTPFKISVDKQFIEDTLLRVKLYRPSIDIATEDWEDGAPASKMNELVQYWLKQYDWFKIQDQINADLTHYATTIPEARDYKHPIPLHFIHEQSPDPNATPLLLLHGWPSTHLEWQKVIRPLTHPTDPTHPAFHIIAPDLPGFGFSPAPTHPGLGPREMGATFHALMQQLSYPTYAVASTDIGWQIGMTMARDLPTAIRGHFTDFFIAQPTPADTARLANGTASAEEAAYMAGLGTYFAQHAGYAMIQSTKPLAVALALADSPVGFAGWVWQLLTAVSDGFAYTPAEVITSALMLWIQGPYGNLRSYKEFFKPEYQSFDFSDVPLGVSQWGAPKGPFAALKDMPFVPREWVERSSNVTFFKRHAEGGHFPAQSQTEAWVDDVRAFLKG